MAPTPATIFGPLLIGSFFNSILYGILVVQVYMYYQTYKKDALWNRILVIYLLIAETLNTAFDFGLVYEPLCLKWGQPVAMIISPTMLRADAVVTAAISVPCQIYYAWRIRVTTQSNIIPAFILFFAFTSLAGGITTTISVSLAPQFSQFSTFEYAVAIWLVSSAIADLIVTVTLVWFLRKNQAGLTSMATVVNKIIILTVQTGTITSIAAIADVVTFLGIGNTTIQFIWDLAISKLYSNSLLSVLNARAGWNESMDRRKNPLSFIDVEKLNVSVWDPEKQQPLDITQPRPVHIQFPSSTP